VFVLSAIMAGVAGALYVPQVGIINPSEFAPASSIEIVIWVAVGGRGTLHGAVLGAFLVNYAKTYLTGAMPELWLFALGGLFIAVTLFLPKGIIGTLAGLSWSPSRWSLPRGGLASDTAASKGRRLAERRPMEERPVET
jgi:urea transport system permease protein